MAVSRLAPLNHRKISVEVSQNGLKKTLCGTASYGCDPALGGVLTINVRESWGDFDFILRDDEFDGEITAGSGDCDYQIRLAAASLCKA
jgi:hypothetical protein